MDIKILCEMLETKIGKDYYVNIVTPNQWIMHKRTESLLYF